MQKLTKHLSTKFSKTPFVNYLTTDCQEPSSHTTKQSTSQLCFPMVIRKSHKVWPLGVRAFKVKYLQYLHIYKSFLTSPRQSTTKKQQFNVFCQFIMKKIHGLQKEHKINVLYKNLLRKITFLFRFLIHINYKITFLSRKKSIITRMANINKMLKLVTS